MRVSSAVGNRAKIHLGGWASKQARDGDDNDDDDDDNDDDDGILQHKNKDLSTSRLFCRAAPDDKQSNTQ